MPSFPSLGIATKAVIAARINRNRWLTFAGWLQAKG
jgi:hypothetical protein